MRQSRPRARRYLVWGAPLLYCRQALGRSQKGARRSAVRIRRTIQPPLQTPCHPPRTVTTHKAGAANSRARN